MDGVLTMAKKAAGRFSAKNLARFMDAKVITPPDDYKPLSDLDMGSGK